MLIKKKICDPATNAKVKLLLEEAAHLAFDENEGGDDTKLRNMKVRRDIYALDDEV
jgi:hypothetical protein